jgi:long-chain acyl-CoA synthetase
MEAQCEGRAPGALAGSSTCLADKLVLSKIRERFGGRVRFFISGSAALNPRSPEVVRVGGPARHRGLRPDRDVGRVVRQPPVHRWVPLRHGRLAAPGTDVKIAEDGEILVKGPGVMRGYRNRPDATAEVFDEDGYFRTGDIGEIDANGFVKITDRKKDLFKTSGGKYIAPSQIESAFKAHCPYVSQILVFGDGRNYATALVTLDPDAITAWGGQPDGRQVLRRDQSDPEVRELHPGLHRHPQHPPQPLGDDQAVHDPRP